METWYRASQYKIEAIDVVKETLKQVVYMDKRLSLGNEPDRYDERREMKESNSPFSHHKWFKDKTDAYDHIIAFLEQSYEGKRKATEIAKRKLDAMIAERGRLQCKTRYPQQGD